MRRPVIIVALLLLLVGCVGIDPTLVEDSAKNICGRHDAYVLADTTIPEPEKQAYLLETELLLKVIEEAKAK